MDGIYWCNSSVYLLVKRHQTKKINESKQRLHDDTEAKAREDPTNLIN